jgi:regulator of protease activity HflC (stomatin/prohibitin superfamily)
MNSAEDILIGTAVDGSLAVIVLGVIFRIWGGTLGIPKPNKIQPFQRGVLMKGEVVDRVLEPGTHWVSPKRTVFLCDTRPKPFQFNSQDVQAAGHIWIRVSMRGATQVVDAARYVTASSDSLATFYTELRRVLTEAAQAQSAFGRAEDKAKLAAQAHSLLEREAEALGMTVSSLDVWEVMPLYSHRADEDEVPILPVQ